MKIYKGNLEITSGNASQYKDLVEVTGYLYINSNAELSAPNLESVGGDLSINSNAINNFPNNVKIKCLRKICGNVGRMKFEEIDGIACAILSVKSKDELTIKRCRKAVFKDGGLSGDPFYIASNSKNNAHGRTMKEAIEELHFKEASRDIQKYRNMPISTKKTPKEWAHIYRTITGACKLGTEMFMEEKKLKKNYSLKEILEETKNSYGGKRFREVVDA